MRKASVAPPILGFAVLTAVHGSACADSARRCDELFSPGEEPQTVEAEVRYACFAANDESVARSCFPMSAAFDPASRIRVSYSRMDVERKRDAIDAQSALAFLFLPTYSCEFPPAGPLPVFGPLHQSPAHRVQMNVFDLFLIFLHRNEQEALVEKRTAQTRHGDNLRALAGARKAKCRGHWEA